jgi:hypothetical protein
MDDQEPARYYCEYYCDREQIQRPPYRHCDHGQAPASPAPPSTPHPVAYGPYAAIGDSTEQARMTPISSRSDNSLYASYPLHVARSLAYAAAHPVHRQSTV